MTTLSRRLRVSLLASAAALPAGCVEFKDSDEEKSASPQTAAVPADSSIISFPSYDTYALDTAGIGARYARFAAYDTSFKRISPQTATARITQFPATIPPQGPTTLHVQVLLDRANFSPGVVDGAWGDNAAKALRWFRSAYGIDTAGRPGATDSTAILDRATYQKLLAVTRSAPVVRKYTVTAEDVKGPFTPIPERVYDQAKLPCLCYASAAEALAERFHTTEKVIAQLNPGVNLAALAAGSSLSVPNVEEVPLTGFSATASASTSAANALDTARDTARSSGATESDAAARGTRTSSATTRDRNTKASAFSSDTSVAGGIARIIVSGTDFWVHAVDASGRILYHFPSTLGAGYDRSPTGNFRITNIAQDPPFHYQPKLFADVPDTKPEARLPAGPNSPVGVVWMAISKPHFGIHGTSTPETIGYENSHGCVRLTNWDARKLSLLIKPGIPVEFRS